MHQQVALFKDTGKRQSQVLGFFVDFVQATEVTDLVLNGPISPSRSRLITLLLVPGNSFSLHFSNLENQ